MKKIFILSVLCLISAYKLTAQVATLNKQARFWQIKPALGVNSSGKGLLSVLVQYDLTKRLYLASHSAFGYALISNKNQIKTNYNYNILQKIGVGYALSKPNKKSSHSLLLLSGFKYSAFSETLNNPLFDKVTTQTKSMGPDFGLMYDLSFGKGKSGFNARFYLPFYPFKAYPLDAINYVAIEFGFALKFKTK